MFELLLATKTTPADLVRHRCRYDLPYSRARPYPAATGSDHTWNTSTRRTALFHDIRYTTRLHDTHAFELSFSVPAALRHSESKGTEDSYSRVYHNRVMNVNGIYCCTYFPHQNRTGEHEQHAINAGPLLPHSSIATNLIRQRRFATLYLVRSLSIG